MQNIKLIATTDEELHKHYTPIIPISKAELNDWMQSLPESEQTWLESIGFNASAGDIGLIPGESQRIKFIVIGIKEKHDCFELGNLSKKLPAGNYFLACDWSIEQKSLAIMSIFLGAYQYSSPTDEDNECDESKLIKIGVNKHIDHSKLCTCVDAINWGRDMINSPANYMLPQQMEQEARNLAVSHDAEINIIKGESLLTKNYPAVHAVGRASEAEPRVIDIQWQPPGGNAEKSIVLVGKGVSFDSGGLNIKSGSGMRIMKKDMGGAAHVLALGKMIMQNNLNVRLRILIAAVENAIAGNALRPGDVINTRKGLTVEIDNTDAEGRLILADILTEACDTDMPTPDAVIDFATLTGAARVAVGTEIAAIFSNDDEIANRLSDYARELDDPIWRLPLYAPYLNMLNSQVANFANSSGSFYGGAIVAALFLQSFIKPEISWVHFDMMAWNNRSRPGHPEGGEVMGIRALYSWIENDLLS